MDIAVVVYEVLLPMMKKFNLIHQIKKCAVSIPSNIAEGSGRNYDRNLCNFLELQMGQL
jgi:four helix bundle protein